ncbi:MAG: nucleotide exchange factor GrpE [Chloroflexi bacterium]|nr:nucleotide exchange factor GrpE [Chloroflexota bacterium]
MKEGDHHEAEVTPPQPELAGSEGQPSLEERFHTLEKELQERRAEAESLRGNWQRTAADFNNYKRRVEQERTDLGRYATAGSLASILPVLDDLERALAVVPDSLAKLTWVDGVFLIYRKLLAILEAQGVREISTEDGRFDPRLHEAVARGEGEEGKLLQVFQKGYMLHDRVLRPALVEVGQGSGAREPSSAGAPTATPLEGSENAS